MSCILVGSIQVGVSLHLAGCSALVLPNSPTSRSSSLLHGYIRKNRSVQGRSRSGRRRRGCCCYCSRRSKSKSKFGGSGTHNPGIVLRPGIIPSILDEIISIVVLGFLRFFLFVLVISLATAATAVAVDHAATTHRGDSTRIGFGCRLTLLTRTVTILLIRDRQRGVRVLLQRDLRTRGGVPRDGRKGGTPRRPPSRGGRRRRGGC